MAKPLRDARGTIHKECDPPYPYGVAACDPVNGQPLDPAIPGIPITCPACRETVSWRRKR